MLCMQSVTLICHVTGALDLKPDDFQAAFASGVVGALTASQQVCHLLCLPFLLATSTLLAQD